MGFAYMVFERLCNYGKWDAWMECEYEVAIRY
jgi:hypothetical protein